MAQNKQEHFVALITKYSVGSAFVFEPDEYRKGNATREPADLVWHCNGCTVLIYMRYYQNGKGVTRNQDKSRRCSKHNLDQACGWIKEWKGGRNLVGKNNYQEFAITHSTQEHIAVLSLVDGHNCLAKCHDDFAREHGLTCCCTVPQNVVEELVKLGASSIDLIHYMLKMSAIEDYVESTKCIELVKADFNNICQIVDSSRKWIGKYENQSYDYLVKTMKSLVYLGDGKLRDKDSIGFAERLSDLPSMDYWVLVTQMLDQREHARINQKVCWSRIVLPLSGIHIVLASGSMKGVSSNMKEVLKLNDPLDGITPSFILIWNFITAEIENTTIAINAYDAMPYTKRYLDEYRLTGRRDR